VCVCETTFIQLVCVVMNQASKQANYDGESSVRMGMDGY